MTQSKQSAKSITLDYLQQDPTILMAYPEIFAAMQVPHPSGGMTSLVERQLKILREKNQALEQRINDLVNIARENEQLSQRFHRLTLALIRTDQLDDILSIVENQVQTFFHTDYVSFHFLPSATNHKPELSAYALQQGNPMMETMLPWLKSRQIICGQQDKPVNHGLFGDTVNIASSAIIPLFQTDDFGLLCLGSANEARFNPSMGTLFLEQLGELVSIRVQDALNH